MGMRLEVTFLDGHTAEATIIPGDTALFERKYNMAAADADENPRVEHLLFLAYTSLARTGQAGGAMDFDSFMQLVADIDPDALTIAQAELMEAKAALKLIDHADTAALTEAQAAIDVAVAKVQAATIPLETPTAG